MLFSRLTEQPDPPDLRTPSDDQRITVRDVAELLRLPESQVFMALEEIHREAWEARMSTAIREAEEPFYRVERPSTSNADPLHSSPIHRLRSVQILAERAHPKLTPDEKPPSEKESTLAKFLGNAILVSVLLLVFALLVKAALVAMH